MTPKEIGDIGENYTADFLVRQGCRILARNFRVRGGEIDIVAIKGSIVHIVEVKSRKKDPLVTGDEAMTKTKISRILKATSEFIYRNNIENTCIFDVAFVEIDNGVVTGFRYIQRAFTA